MEDWQEEFVIKRKPHLLKTIFCNKELLSILESSDVLARPDKEEILSISEEKNLDRTDKLLTILGTRIHGYYKLSIATWECRQSAAFIILRQGFLEGCLHAVIDYGNTTLKLKQFLKSDSENSEISNIIEEVFTQNESAFLDLCRSDNKSFMQVKNTIPPELPYYISRQIVARVNLNPALFNSSCGDIFIFKDIERHQLANIAGRNPTRVSGDQQRKLTSRFILLEHQDHLTKIIQNSASPVHLIKYLPDQKYSLEQTWRISDQIRQYVCEDETTFSEDDFVALVQYNASSGACLSDKPGTGKSTLLANMARKIQNQNNGGIVAFIKLAEFLQSKKACLSKLCADKTKCLELVVDFVYQTDIAKAIFFHLIHNSLRKFHIFFDGFDELAQSNLELAATVFKTLTTHFSNIRLYITTRPHTQKYIAKSLGFISYQISPLSKNDRIEYLVNYWINQCSNGNSTKLKVFANFCLNEADKRSSTDPDKDNIYCNPLYCYLLANIYAEQAVNFCDDLPSPDSDLVFYSVSEMYARFFEQKFLDKEKIEAYHIFSALQLLFPEVADKYKQYSNVKGKLSPKHLCSYGILEEETCDGEIQLQFIHRTFAEYLVAELFFKLLCNNISILSDESVVSELLQFCLKELFASAVNDNANWKEFSKSKIHISYNRWIPGGLYASFNFPQILYFVNAKMESNLADKDLKLYKNNVTFSYFLNTFKENQIYHFFQSCIYDRFDHIFNFLAHLLHHFSEDKLLAIKQHMNFDIEVHRLVLFASKHSNRSVIERYVELFLNCFDFDIARYLRDLSIKYVAPIHVAVERGNYDITEYLVKQLNVRLYNRGIIASCAYFSNRNSLRVVKVKKQILSLLFNEDPNLVNESWGLDYSLPPPEIHVKLLKVMMKHGIKTRQINGDNDTILHYAAKYMSKNDYKLLVQFFKIEMQDTNIFAETNKNGRNVLHETLYLVYGVEKETIQTILECPGIDINALDEKQENCIMLAIKGYQSTDVLAVLANHGANLQIVNNEGDNILDIVKDYENGIALSFLLMGGLSYDFKSSKCLSTMLHLAAVSQSPDDLNESLNMFIKAGHTEVLNFKNKLGLSPLHLAITNPRTSRENLETMVANGADVNSCDNAKNNVLFTAIIFRREKDFIETLIKLGASYENKNENGENILHQTVKALYPDCTRYLLDLGVSPNERSSQGVSPIELANGYLQEYEKKRSEYKQEILCIREIIRLLSKSTK